MMRRAQWMIVMLALAACDDGQQIDNGGVDVPDASPDAVVDASPRDAAPPMDARPNPDMRVEPDADVDQSVACTPSATAPDGPVVWRWWDPAPAPTARVELVVQDADCGGLRGATDADWLEAVFDPAGGLRLTAIGPIPSGRHTAHAWLAVADGTRLAEVEVELQRLTRPENGVPKVLVIGADGVRSDAFLFADTPELDHWSQHGAFTATARTQLTADTVSGPGWTSILTGVEPVNHGVQGNGDLDERDPRWPTFLKRVRDFGLSTGASCQWLPILTNILEDDATDWRGTGNQNVVTAVAAEQLRTADHAVLFVHMDDPDHAGHGVGFSIDVPEYVAAIEGVDADTQRLIDAVFDRPTIADEDWLFIFTTDHGGRGQSHGPRDAEHQIIPLIVAGPAADPSRLGADASHLAVHATVLAHLGAAPDDDWALDAPPVGLASEGACFDRIDNDADGALDCADTDCACPCAGMCPGGEPPPPPTCPTADAEMALGLAAIQGDTADGEGRMADCGGFGPEKSFEWVAPVADRYTFNTVGSDYDTVLSLRTECAAPSQQCNADLYPGRRDDVPLNVQSRVFAELAEGDRVFVVIDGEGDAQSGGFTVNIHGQQAECGDADLASATGEAVAAGNNAEAPTRYPDACATAARDHTLRWVAPSAGSWRFDTFGSDFDTVLWILDAECSGEAQGCNDDAMELQSAVDVELAEGDEIRIVVAGFRGRNGNWQLNITPPAKP